MALDPLWVARLHTRAELPPTAPRIALHLRRGGPRIGSIAATTWSRMHDAQLPILEADGRLALVGAPDAALASIARWLHAKGLAGGWRDELLDVPDDHDLPVAAVERAAVRPLGITTRAVHLIGRTADGHVWLQQRASDKATDPNRWDTLMGGLIAARESVAQTLERETWEEAGLRIEALRDVVALGRVVVRRPVTEGYMVEHIEMFEALVPDTLVPVNQDGEVQRFEAVTQHALVDRLQSDAFTLEAALVLAHWLASDVPRG